MMLRNLTRLVASRRLITHSTRKQVDDDIAQYLQALQNEDLHRAHKDDLPRQEELRNMLGDAIKQRGDVIPMAITARLCEIYLRGSVGWKEGFLGMLMRLGSQEKQVEESTQRLSQAKKV